MVETFTLMFALFKRPESVHISSLCYLIKYSTNPKGCVWRLKVGGEWFKCGSCYHANYVALLSYPVSLFSWSCCTWKQLISIYILTRSYETVCMEQIIVLQRSFCRENVLLWTKHNNSTNNYLFNGLTWLWEKNETWILHGMVVVAF